jgi:hypothetical protein
VILPADDSLILPDSDDGALVVDASSPAWNGTQQDLLGLIPGIFRSGSMIDREAVLNMLGNISNEEWARVAFVLEAQQSPRFADGEWLAWWGDILGRRQQPGETAAAYRQRLLTPVAVITPSAIKTAVDAAVALFTTFHAIYLEPALDCAFAAPVVCPWDAFAQPSNQRLLSYYPDAANPNPPSYAVPVTTGGLFWIILPSNAGDYERVPFASPTTNGFTDDWEFVAPVSPIPAWAYGYTARASVPLGELIISEVDRRIAEGTAYFVLFDPFIATAV